MCDDSNWCHKLTLPENINNGLICLDGMPIKAIQEIDLNVIADRPYAELKLILLVDYGVGIQHKGEVISMATKKTVAAPAKPAKKKAVKMPMQTCSKDKCKTKKK